MIVKDIRDLLADLDDNTKILISSRGICNGAIRAPQYFSLEHHGDFDLLILADEKVTGFRWKPIKETGEDTKHLKGLVKGEPVLVTGSGLKIYNPSAKMKKMIRAAVKRAKSGKSNDVLLNFKEKKHER